MGGEKSSGRVKGKIAKKKVEKKCLMLAAFIRHLFAFFREKGYYEPPCFFLFFFLGKMNLSLFFIFLGVFLMQACSIKKPHFLYAIRLNNQKKKNYSFPPQVWREKFLKKKTFLKNFFFRFFFPTQGRTLLWKYLIDFFYFFLKSKKRDFHRGSKGFKKKNFFFSCFFFFFFLGKKKALGSVGKYRFLIRGAGSPDTFFVLEEQQNLLFLRFFFWVFTLYTVPQVYSLCPLVFFGKFGKLPSFRPLLLWHSDTQTGRKILVPMPKKDYESPLKNLPV